MSFNKNSLTPAALLKNSSQKIDYPATSGYVVK